MIDIKTETIVTLQQAAAKLGGIPSRQILSWVHGRRRRLEAFKMGNRWFTSLEALEPIREPFYS